MFAPGDKLEYGHYTVLRELGAGGMGIVYHCRDEFLQREIAIKMLLPELMADDDTVEIFRQEARLAAQLEHPNVVTIHNIGIENKEGKTHHYIAMEFLPGGSLKHRIEGDGEIGLEQSLEWMKQMTMGVNYAHKRGVVHQDIKPDNVFITHDGNLKIGDFGLALIATGVAVERAVQGKGTPAYMSPELCRGDPQDHRSDIYSLGAVFYELLTREKPYKASGMIEMAMKHATAPVPSAKKTNPVVPEVLDKAILKMMAKAPDERYQSLAEVLTILEKLLLEMQMARLGMGTPRSLVDTPPPAAETPAPEKPAAAPEPAVEVNKKTAGMDFDDFISDRPIRKEQPQAQPVAATKKAEASVVDPLDDLLDTLLAEHQTIAPEPKKEEPKKEEPKKEAAKKEEPKKEDPKKDDPKKFPPRFNEDVTTDIDAVFQSRVRAEAAALAQAAQATREAAEVGKTVQGPAAGATSKPSESTPKPPKTGPSAAQKNKEPEIIWAFKTSGPIGWSSSPVLGKNAIYVGSADGFVYAIEATKGNVMWRADTGAAVVASPVVAEDKIFVVSTNGSVQCLSHSGEKLWESPGTAALVATPVLHDGNVLVASMDGTLRYVLGTDGKAKWTYRTEGPLVSPPQILENLVFVTSKDKCLHAVSLDKGWRQWTFQTEAPVVSSPLVSTDSVYIGSTDGHMYAVEAESGNMIWRYSTESPIVSKGTLEFTSVTVCTEDKWVHCIEKYKGILVWKSKLHSPVMSNLVSNAGSLYVANREGWLQCFNLKNGELKWQMDCRARLESPPMVSGKIMYLGKVSGEVAAYSLPS